MAASVFFSANPTDPAFVRRLSEVFEAFCLYPFLLFPVYVGRLHAAANSAAYALETHRIGENNVFKVHDEGLIGKVGLFRLCGKSSGLLAKSC